MITATNWRSITWRILATVLLAAAAACNSPLDVDTPRRFTRVNLDSLVVTPSFIGAPGDSIFAFIDTSQIVFATEVVRPLFTNRLIDGQYYITVVATRYGLNSSDYEAMSLRLEGIRDTGTYRMNAPYKKNQKQIDIGVPPSYGALYQRRVNGHLEEEYGTGDPRSSGTIHVIRIDEVQGVIVGTFEFIGYSEDDPDRVVTISRGAFRLYLKK